MFSNSDYNKDTEDKEDETIIGPKNHLNHEAKDEVILGNRARL